MRRRDVLTRTALGGAALATLGTGLVACSEPESAGAPAAPAVMRARRTLKLVTAWPKNLPGLGEAPERIAQRVTEMTEGALTVKVYAADELVPAFGIFDAVSAGDAEMYHGSEYYWQGKSKAFTFFTAVPFGLTAEENNAWIHHGGGQALWDELSGRFNLKALPAGNTGVQMGGWFNREIRSLEDFKGLKLRMPGLGGEVARRLGATAVSLPAGDIFPALQNGTIDATEWIGPWNDMALGFHQIAKFYYYPGWQEAGPTLALGINLDVWKSLSASQQAIVRAASLAEDNYMLAQFNHHNAVALGELTATHGVTLRPFPADVMAEAQRQSAAVLEEAAGADPLTRRVYESFSQVRRAGQAWAQVSELAFSQARLAP